MNNQNERRASTYIVLAVILLLTLLLVYYALTAGDIKQLSVEVTSWELKSISNPFYPINIVNITSVFNSSNNHLYLLVKLKNSGSSDIKYISGCISPFSGVVYPSSIANLTYEAGVASCNAIAVNQLLPNQTATLQWPLSPQIITILKAGNFDVNLTFPFSPYSNITKICPRMNTTCPAIKDFTENATIYVSISAVN